MAITVPVTSGDYSTANSGAASSINVTKPANVANGDLLVAWVCYRNSGSTFTAPSGWTESVNQSTGQSEGVYYKPIPSAAAETSTSYTWSFTGGTARCGVILFRVVGANLSTPVDATGTFESGPTGSLVFPAVTAVSVQACLLAFGLALTTTTNHPVFSAPSAMTTLAQQAWDNGTAGASMWVGFDVLSSSGSTGTQTATLSPSANSGNGVMLTITPAVTSVNYVANLSDNLGMTDTGLSETLASVEALGSTVALSDIVSASIAGAGLNASASDGLPVTSIATAKQGNARAQADNVGLTDTVTAALDVAAGGATIPRVIPSPPTVRALWLGLPGNMVRLPAPSVGFTADANRAEVVQQLLSGGTSVIRRRLQKRTWTYNYAFLVGTDLSTVQAFYRGFYTDGPFRHLTMEAVNRLSTDTSLSGLNSIGSWTGTTGAVVLDGTPPAVQPGQTLKWNGRATGTQWLAACVVSGSNYTPDSNSATYVPDQAWTFSCYLQASQSINVTLALLGLQATTGAPVTTYSTAAVVAGTWSRFSVTLPAGSWPQASTPYIVPALATSTPGTVWMSNPQLEYGASVPSGWTAGEGVPTVTVAAALPRALDSLYSTTTSLALAEI